MSTSKDLNARRARAVPRGVASATVLFAGSAENALIRDASGRTYIDFASGIGVLATGHRHPRVMDAVRTQLELFSHTAFQVMAYESYIALAERLNAIAPFSAPAKSVFFTTGAEAVENAVKIARVHTGRNAVIAFSGAFHGRTLLTSSLTGKIAPYKKGAGAPAPEIFRLPFPIQHRDISVDDALGALDRLFYGDVDPSRVAAIIIEVVQGEGGFNVAPPELMRALRAACDAHGIVLIVDEIQSGFGRTGRMFAVEHTGVEPDLVTVAKSIAGGFPLSGVIGRANLMDAVEPGGLGGTYGGSPLGCVAALTVLDIIHDEGLLARADEIGSALRAVLEPLMGNIEGTPVANLRGLGAMLAFDVVKAGGGNEPDGPAAKSLTARALAAGFVVLTCGTHGETVRLLPPLTIPDKDLKEASTLLVQTIRQTQ